jgi:hypothetical protein
MTPGTPEPLCRDHSGRRLVLIAGTTVVVLWGILYVVFIDWRARYRTRAAYGATHVIPALERLEAIVPPDAKPDEWREALNQTRVMLLTVVGSNLLGVKEMDQLRIELDQAVARMRARPETGREELAGIWNEMADRAEFLFRDSRSADGHRHSRPKILPPEPEKRLPTPAAAKRFDGPWLTPMP